MKCFSILATCLLLLSACKQEHISGIWLYSDQAAPNQVQGFRLNKDGSAESINLPVHYTSWQRHDDKLILISQNLQNNHRIKIAEEYLIRQPDSNTLELRMDNTLFIYTRPQIKPKR